MGKTEGKPGVMLYFEIIPAIERLTDEQRGKLLLGIIRYARDGTDPMETLDELCQMLWIIIKPTIDRDDENYYRKVENAKRSVEKREARRKRINEIIAENSALTPGVRRILQDAAAPEEEETEAYASVTERNQLQSQQQPQQQNHPQIQGQNQFEIQRQRNIQKLLQSEY